MAKCVIVTGSSGLIGSEVCVYLNQTYNCVIHGVDNNQRAVFFGPQGDTKWNQKRLQTVIKSYVHHDIDIRDRIKINDLIKTIKPDAIIHAAAQPSHDRAASIPFDDFDTNATGTLNLIEAVRQHCHDAAFVHMSTNKVYGDRPNQLKLIEENTRWEFEDAQYKSGISESFPIDQSMHSLFGASKLASDIIVQEYGRYFGMPTCVLRGGCLTGPNHTGVELHGFLSYLVKCNLEGLCYNVYGYKGKQVRDNIHSLDVARFIGFFIDSPRCGEVYNIGGGKANSCSIIEAFDMVEKISGKQQNFNYVDQNRKGDHICYYSDLTKMKSHYKKWDISINLAETIREIVNSWRERK